MHWPKFGGSSSSSSSSSASRPVAKTTATADSAPKDHSNADGQFDPESLERGAAALKQIDGSKNAKLAFELAKVKESTTQHEHQQASEKLRMERFQMEEQLASVQAEESRRTISHYADQERDTARHKAQVDASLQGQKLETQNQQMGYQLQKEQHQFEQHEQIRMQNEINLEELNRETIRVKAQFDKENAVSTALAMAKGNAEQERENIEVRMREMRAKSAEERRTRLMAIEEIFSGMSNGMYALYEDRQKAIGLVGGLTAVAIGVYSARSAARVAGTVLERRLGRPPLVRETSRWTMVPKLTKSSWWPFAKEKPGIFENLVLEETLSERLQWTTNALLKAQENGTPFRHLLLHGNPGTGKTLFARTLARQSGLDYAIMSGGDIGPLGREGPNELHKLFAWANSSKRGLVLFIDEADSFLRTGRGGEGAMSEDARNALSVFLHHTGTESARVAVILATNIPSSLDRAVIDRIDEAFEFPLPQKEQRTMMLNMFMKQYLQTPTKRGKIIEVDDKIDESFIDKLAERTKGLSGRQLSKLILAFQSAVYGSGTKRLTHGLAETVVDWRLNNPDA